mmetsp:Transcript_1491/g.6523  ORF Transcript_1491/g.6523 Transcript_1491/m.6523 type:complete len:378 (+) Transcript_1491:116-1249(+)
MRRTFLLISCVRWRKTTACSRKRTERTTMKPRLPPQQKRTAPRERRARTRRAGHCGLQEGRLRARQRRRRIRSHRLATWAARSPRPRSGRNVRRRSTATPLRRATSSTMRAKRRRKSLCRRGSRPRERERPEERRRVTWSVRRHTRVALRSDGQDETCCMLGPAGRPSVVALEWIRLGQVAHCAVRRLFPSVIRGCPPSFAGRGARRTSRSILDMNKKKEDSAYRVVAENRVARRNYEIFDTIEAGLELKGTEVKSVRYGSVNLRDGFAAIDDAGEIWLRNVHIPEHKTTGGYFNHKPKRPRKMLMHKKEIRKLRQQIMEKGVTLVPLRIYFNKRSWVKVLVGIGKGKKLYDKREAIKRRDTDRMVNRAIRAGMRGE